MKVDRVTVRITGNRCEALIIGDIPPNQANVIYEALNAHDKLKRDNAAMLEACKALLDSPYYRPESRYDPIDMKVRAAIAQAEGDS